MDIEDADNPARLLIRDRAGKAEITTTPHEDKPLPRNAHVAGAVIVHSEHNRQMRFLLDNGGLPIRTSV